MNIIDKIYYLMYCMATFSSETPYMYENYPGLLPAQTRAKGYFALTMVFIFIDFTKYT